MYKKYFCISNSLGICALEVHCVKMHFLSPLWRDRVFRHPELFLFEKLKVETSHVHYLAQGLLEYCVRFEMLRSENATRTCRLRKKFSTCTQKYSRGAYHHEGVWYTNILFCTICYKDVQADCVEKWKALVFSHIVSLIREVILTLCNIRWFLTPTQTLFWGIHCKFFSSTVSLEDGD